MPISATGADVRLRTVGKSGERGFTLVELMVVLVIIGLATTTVALAWPDNRARVRSDATRFAARLRAAHDEAIIEGTPIRAWLSADGYGFDRRLHGEWVAMADRPFARTQWQSGVQATVGSDAKTSGVILDPTGLASAATDFELTAPGARARVHIAGDGGAQIDAR